MLATVYLYLKKSALLSLVAIVVVLLEFDWRAEWVTPTVISLLGFVFMAGGVYFSVRKDLENYYEFKAEARRELSHNAELREEVNTLKNQVRELKQSIEPPQPPTNSRRWRGNESR